MNKICEECKKQMYRQIIAKALITLEDLPDNDLINSAITSIDELLWAEARDELES